MNLAGSLIHTLIRGSFKRTFCWRPQLRYIYYLNATKEPRQTLMQGDGTLATHTPSLPRGRRLRRVQRGAVAAEEQPSCSAPSSSAHVNGVNVL